ncbi:hypothetical protein IFM89_038726 [Coptis chinensis]|uniref:DUF659 domain-containing protein n=1 Tax=Coptis chinensis TaxID=261450 RepID=A0A835H224_9MAGN|nr:hypothetical protein IFM89_038726 [Coptis chinensis]
MGSLFRRSSSMRAGKQPDIATIDVDLIRREDTKQPSIKQSFKAGSRALGDQFRTFFGKFIHYAAINPHQAIANPYTQPMIDAACRAGLGVKPPSAYDLFHKELDIIYLEVEEYIEALRSKWATYGVTVMCDGWTGPTRKSLMNFLVYCDGQCCYVGKENVVQIVTDNGPNYKKGENSLARLPDFCKRASVLKLIKKAKVVVTYLYNHSRVCELMRRLCGGDIVRPALTRFATNFLAFTVAQDHDRCLGPDIATQTLCLSEVSHAAEWWTLHGGDAPTSRAVAIKILSQTVASSGSRTELEHARMVHSHCSVTSMPNLDLTFGCTRPAERMHLLDGSKTMRVRTRVGRRWAANAYIAHEIV